MAESSIDSHNGATVEAKGPYNVSEVADSSFGSAKDLPPDEKGYGDGWGDAHTDMLDMRRLGKTQEFKRNFKTISSLGFVSIYMATWEFVLVSLSIGFSNGGLAGIFWCFITTTLCYATIVASLAEMASMAPTSGGQYHWVSEFAPPSSQRILSYASGWMTTLGWLASVASSVYVCATEIQAIINAVNANYAFSAWQLTLIMLAFVVLTILFNTYGTPIFPQLETASLVGHTIGFFVVMIPVLVLCPKNSAHDVFLKFSDQSGFGNMGAAYLTCQIYVLWCCLGSDSVVHIAEEVADASLVVPRAMWWSYVGNVIAGFVMVIVMLFCIGPLEPVINAYWPFMVLFNRTGSVGLAVFLNVLLFVLIYLGNITALATCAREVWAFARDKGLPFSGFIGKMNQKWNIPFNAVYVTSAICAILCLIQLGSTTAFNILVSVSVVGLLSTYMLSIGCVLLRRIRGQALPPARWSLGRWGIYINGFAFFYAAFIVVLACFPTYLPIDLASANWAPLIWVAIMVLSAVVYMIHGRRKYTAPVEFVEGRKAAGVGLQQST